MSQSKHMVSIKLSTDGSDYPPKWATGEQLDAFWYFENEHGEPWVAKVVDDELLIAGSESGWDEIRLTLEQAEKDFPRLLRYVATGKVTLPELPADAPDDTRQAMAQVAAAGQGKELPAWFGITLSASDLTFSNECEVLWLLSVISAARHRMRWARERGKSTE